jgi:hypothetical protein
MIRLDKEFWDAIKTRGDAAKFFRHGKVILWEPDGCAPGSVQSAESQIDILLNQYLHQTGLSELDRRNFCWSISNYPPAWLRPVRFLSRVPIFTGTRLITERILAFQIALLRTGLRSANAPGRGDAGPRRVRKDGVGRGIGSLLLYRFRQQNQCHRRLTIAVCATCD